MSRARINSDGEIGAIKRTPVRISGAYDDCLVALADDGSLWTLDKDLSGKKVWYRLPELPDREHTIPRRA